MKKLILAFAAFSVAMFISACDQLPTANDIQRDQQSQINSEGAREVGMPNIKNFREMRLMKAILEMRDQDDLQTWAYIFNLMTGKFTLVCPAIGFPIPYSTQYSASESMQPYSIRGTGGNGRYFGTARLPQSEPNGLNMPASSDATWVMCIGPDKQPHATYMEDKLDTFLFQLPESMLQH